MYVRPSHPIFHVSSSSLPNRSMSSSSSSSAAVAGFLLGGSTWRMGDTCCRRGGEAETHAPWVVSLEDMGPRWLALATAPQDRARGGMHSPGSAGLQPGGRVSSSPARSAEPPAWRRPAADPAPLWRQRRRRSDSRAGLGPAARARARGSPPRRLWFSTSRLVIRVTSSLWSPPGPLEAPEPELCKAGGGWELSAPACS